MSHMLPFISSSVASLLPPHAVNGWAENPNQTWYGCNQLIINHTRLFILALLVIFIHTKANLNNPFLLLLLYCSSIRPIKLSDVRSSFLYVLILCPKYCFVPTVPTLDWRFTSIWVGIGAVKWLWGSYQFTISIIWVINQSHFISRALCIQIKSGKKCFIL